MPSLSSFGETLGGEEGLFRSRLIYHPDSLSISIFGAFRRIEITEFPGASRTRLSIHKSNQYPACHIARYNSRFVHVGSAQSVNFPGNRSTGIPPPLSKITRFFDALRGCNRIDPSQIGLPLKPGEARIALEPSSRHRRKVASTRERKRVNFKVRCD